MKNLDIKAVVKSMEIIEKIFMAEEKTGWTSTLTRSNLYVLEKEKPIKYNYYSTDSYFRVDYSSVNPQKNIIYYMGTVFNPYDPFKYDIYLGQSDLKTGYLTFLLLDWKGIEYETLFDDFLKGKISKQITASLKTLCGDVFNMVNFTLPPNFGNDV